MKIVATVRTLNEESNIRKFCESYSQFADSILIADGGSTDNTVLLASEYSKVDVDYFMDVVECDGGFFRNPDGPHIQFLIDWAVR
jgi:glycosyltransferase involved in cell wall biosynthesis